MKKIYFATTNKGKLEEARKILAVDIEAAPLRIDEIQSLDPVEVAIEKARACFKKLSKPVFVEDVALTFKALGRLPGTYIDSFFKELGNEGLTGLLKGKDDRSARAQTTVVYLDKKGDERVFIGRVKGMIALEPKGEKGFGWDPIFIPEGERRTFGQMNLEEKNKYSMRARALRKFKAWMDKASDK